MANKDLPDDIVLVKRGACEMVKSIVSTFALLVILPAAFFMGCGNSAAPELQTDPVPVTILKHQMSVHEFAGDVVQSIAVVTGTAENSGNTTVPSASIEASYYDKNGKLLGSASAIIENLAPGALWSFTIEFKGPDAWKAVAYDLALSTRE